MPVLLLRDRAPAAGAGCVLCSRWPVLDDAAATLQSASYAGLGEGATLPAALHRGIGALRAHPDFADPFDWAAWQLLT